MPNRIMRLLRHKYHITAAPLIYLGLAFLPFEITTRIMITTRIISLEHLKWKVRAFQMKKRQNRRLRW